MKKYSPIHQLPYCCVPATIQWVLLRRGCNIGNQEEIGVQLGLRVPVKMKKYFQNRKIKIVPDNSKEVGTQILKKKYSISNYFKKNNIQLKISKEFRFKNKKELEVFLLNNLGTDKDLILRFHSGIYKENGAGHLGIIINYNKKSKIVVIGDPEPPFFKKITLEKLLESLSKKFDGIQRGPYLIYDDRC
jgi:hypothetical protein